MNLNNSTKISFIQFMPVSLFGSVMGLCGLCFSWRRAEKYWHFTEVPSIIFGWMAVVSFIALAFCYSVKSIKYRDLVSSEFKNPVTLCFFATISVSLLLLPGVILPYLPLTAKVMWIFGASSMFLFAWYVFRSWIDNMQEQEKAMPVWVLPIVGMLDLPIVGHQIDLPGMSEISIMAFGIGSIFSIILLTIIISRLIFQPALPEAVQPSILILLAPMALAFTVYGQFKGVSDTILGALFYFNIFLLLVLGSKISMVLYSCPFKVSWWAVSFPLSAVTISTQIYAQHKPDWVHQLLAAVLLVLTTAVIIFLFFQTLYKIAKRKLA
ncbi:SLAC1 anion channel family protein [Pedobacter jamesrossensis]|uniref:SLAC1 anion channel family protein n=1 Tax=Pedobacter jamesrossensis TaxID=1908238 RepID=A0ABV8NLW4_9SPHI